jgi:glutathione synthase/RimK-type ligase-like ATP-grasp enzyme
MTKVLILSNHMDAHARIVLLGLKLKGITAARWIPENYLKSQKSNFKVSPLNNDELHLNDGHQNLDLMDYDAVWFRRQAIPKLSQNIHSNDQDFVFNENMSHMRAIWFALEKKAFCVNPISSYYKANSKLLQLQLAKQLGLFFPETLISNNLEDLKTFIKKNQPNETIYKTFVPNAWEENDEMFSFYTTVISEDLLPSSSVLALTPGIYQKRINKQFEVRATFFGNTNISVKIVNSAEDVDWRLKSATSGLKIEPITLCKEIENKCLLMMKELGIVFGCFDFIVTDDNQYVFLEVNEMGQFLWIEELLPELKMLDNFCNLFLSANFNQQSKIYPPINQQEILNSNEYKNFLQKDNLSLLEDKLKI